VNAHAMRQVTDHAPERERPSGVPREGRIDPSGNLFWAAVVGALVLGLAGLVFWLALRP
jgi:hypothetical protein